MGDKSKSTARKSTEMTHSCSGLLNIKKNSGSRCPARERKQVLGEMLTCLLWRGHFFVDWASSFQRFLVPEQAALSWTHRPGCALWRTQAVGCQRTYINRPLYCTAPDSCTWPENSPEEATVFGHHFQRWLQGQVLLMSLGESQEKKSTDVSIF